MGGCGLINPSFSQIFGIVLTWQDPLEEVLVIGPNMTMYVLLVFDPFLSYQMGVI